MLLTDILTVAQIAVSHIKLFHSTGAGRTRMQLAKVVITSALVLAACAEGLPEGKRCVLKDVKLFHILYHGCYSWLQYDYVLALING